MYIVDGDTPENCDECPMRQINLSRCQKTGRSTSHYPSGKPMDPKRRPRWCPIRIELDKDHGSLVDAMEADTVYKTIAEEKIRKCMPAGYEWLVETAIRQIRNMEANLHIIIPEERRNNDS